METRGALCKTYLNFRHVIICQHASIKQRAPPPSLVA